MYKQLLIHKKNNVSFSYQSGSLNKYNFQKYNMNTREYEIKSHNTVELVHQTYQPFTLNNQYHNINTVKDGIYHINDDWVHSFVNINYLYNMNEKSSNLYSFVMKLLQLDNVDFNGRMKNVFNNNICFLTSTFQPEDCLDVNLNDYYEVYIKNKHEPIYLQENARVYDEQGMPMTIFNLIHKFGKRKLLGIDKNQFVCEYEVSKVIVKNPVDEMKNVFDVPFLGLGVIHTFNKPIIMDNIIVNVSLD
jgi:hypothetical protein